MSIFWPFFVSQKVQSIKDLEKGLTFFVWEK